MQCKNCSLPLGEDTAVCRYCGFKQKRKPGARKLKPGIIALIAVVFVVVSVTPALAPLIVSRWMMRGISSISELPTWDPPPARDRDTPGYTIITAQQLLDESGDRPFRAVRINAAVNSYTHHEAGSTVYGRFFPYAIYTLYAEDETGPFLLTLGETFANRDDTWRSGTRFHGFFWDLRDVDGVQMPRVEVFSWEQQ